MITHDPSTWPTGDVFWRIAHAIAHAEGADIQGTVPDVLNNPGDISDGVHLYGSQHHSGSDVTIFPDKARGWQWLHDKLQRIADGASSSYTPLMSWTEIAKEWAGNWNNWVKNVCGNYITPSGQPLGLNVPKDSLFIDYVEQHRAAYK